MERIDVTSDHDSDGFLPTARLFELERTGAVAVEGALLRRDDHAWAIQDAVRVLGVVSHDTDPFGLIGSIVPLRRLIESGFALSAGQMALGRIRYALEHGVVCQPI